MLQVQSQNYLVLSLVRVKKVTPQSSTQIWSNTHVPASMEKLEGLFFLGGGRGDRHRFKKEMFRRKLTFGTWSVVSVVTLTKFRI